MTKQAGPQLVFSRTQMEQNRNAAFPSDERFVTGSRSGQMSSPDAIAVITKWTMHSASLQLMRIERERTNARKTRMNRRPQFVTFVTRTQDKTVRHCVCACATYAIEASARYKDWLATKTA